MGDYVLKARAKFMANGKFKKNDFTILLHKTLKELQLKIIKGKS
jgi:hypothetical protein